MILRSNQQAAPKLRGGRIDGISPSDTRQYGTARTCADPGCDTRLSVYNPSRWCWVHEAPKDFVTRADRTHEEDRRVVSLDEFRPLLETSRGAQHPEPGPEPAPAPTPPPLPQARSTGRPRR